MSARGMVGLTSPEGDTLGTIQMTEGGGITSPEKSNGDEESTQQEGLKDYAQHVER